MSLCSYYRDPADMLFKVLFIKKIWSNTQCREVWKPTIYVQCLIRVCKLQIRSLALCYRILRLFYFKLFDKFSCIQYLDILVYLIWFYKLLNSEKLRMVKLWAYKFSQHKQKFISCLFANSFCLKFIIHSRQPKLVFGIVSFWTHG